MRGPYSTDSLTAATEYTGRRWCASSSFAEHDRCPSKCWSRLSAASVNRETLTSLQRCRPVTHPFPADSPLPSLAVCPRRSRGARTAPDGCQHGPLGGLPRQVRAASFLYPLLPPGMCLLSTGRIPRFLRAPAPAGSRRRPCGALQWAQRSQPSSRCSSSSPPPGARPPSAAQGTCGASLWRAPRWPSVSRCVVSSNAVNCRALRAAFAIRSSRPERHALIFPLLPASMLSRFVSGSLLRPSGGCDDGPLSRKGAIRQEEARQIGPRAPFPPLHAPAEGAEPG